MQNSSEASKIREANTTTEMFCTPGIYLSPTKGIDDQEHVFGKYSVSMNGTLCSFVTKQNWTIFFDGIYLDSHKVDLSDAERAIDLFLKHGIEYLQKMNGFFNILAINSNGTEIHFISDLLCSRPWYLYDGDDKVAVAPTPIHFANLDLNMSLNAQALYEQLRLLHTGSDRTLMNEVSRILPGFCYSLNMKFGLKKELISPFKQSLDHKLTLEECSKEMTTACADIIQGVLNHPKLKNLPVQIPLTGGLDSRHLLAEVLRQKTTVKELRHVLIQQKDYEPVKKIAKSLEIPLHTDTIKDLDTKDLLHRWISRTGALSNVHQYYLLSLKNTDSNSSYISFNGYLMDLLMGMSVKTANLNSSEPHKAVWNRTYSSPTIRKLLIPDYKKHEVETEKLLKNQVANFKGKPWFKMLMLDLHNRGLHYTGNIDTMLQNEVYSFSPAASLSIYEFASKAPHDVAGDKKARLHALQAYFPDMARFPGVEGIPFSEMKIRPEIIESPIIKNLKSLFKAVLSGFKKNHAPESEHSWIRNNRDLHKIHHSAVFNSELVKDGHIKEKGLKLSWYLNEIGGYQGWILMSFFSAEVAYRILKKKQSKEQVLELLFNK